jgi:TonB family protein
MMKIVPLIACSLLALAPTLASAQGGGGGPGPARARANLPSLFSDEDYPSEAVRNYEEGPVAFRLQIGSSGAPTACSVTASSGSATLDSTTCRLLMERARFEPARDARGRPTTDTYEGRIVWRLPEEEPLPPRLEAAFTLWSFCVTGETAKLALSDLSDDEIVSRSFAPCAALEAQAKSAMGGATSPEEMRSGVTAMVGQLLNRARATLKAPPEPPSGRRNRND